MINETPDPPTPPASAAAVPPASPGAMIREARERAGLSLDDMAAHTKLARATLEALERDDHQALLEPVYVRGYYRKCAKVLEIDEARLIAAYNARVVPRAPEAPAKLRLASGTELGSSSRLPVSMAVLAAVVAVVACAFIWFAREDRQAYPVVAEVIEEVPLGAVVRPTPESTVEVQAEPAADATAVGVDGPQTAPPPTAEPAAQPTAAAAATGSLRLRFVAESWVRIDDAGGRVLLSGLRRAGTVETIQGQAPLAVFLGNAPGVEIEFEGRAVDVRAYVRDNNTARFTLPLP
ncbi:helix-turn-helix domain-containing protein [Sinimarinibacterium thermocellulolyticum]|uniref:RodZ domain-containing protein n=1 Tax=Sinimarinibacterium thermocellulolyticum TaxID=3170016 RepID=A0ABV2ACC6_9GAMM